MSRARKWRQNARGRWVRVRCGALGVRARDDDDDDDDVCDDVRVTRMCAYAPRSAVTRHTRRRRRRRRRRRPSSVVRRHHHPRTHHPSVVARPSDDDPRRRPSYHHGSNALLSFVCIRIQYCTGPCVRGPGRSCVIIFCVRVYIGGVVVPSASGRHERGCDGARVRISSRRAFVAAPCERRTSDGRRTRCRRSWYVHVREGGGRGRGRGRGRHTHARWIVLALRVVGD